MLAWWRIVYTQTLAARLYYVDIRVYDDDSGGLEGDMAFVWLWRTPCGRADARIKLCVNMFVFCTRALLGQLLRDGGSRTRYTIKEWERVRAHLALAPTKRSVFYKRGVRIAATHGARSIAREAITASDMRRTIAGMSRVICLVDPWSGWIRFCWSLANAFSMRIDWVLECIRVLG